MIEFIRSIVFRVRARFVRDELDRELTAELQLHRELLEEEAVRAGASAHNATAIASARLGNVTAIRERTRDRWSFGFIEPLMQDAWYAARFLKRAPAFTIVAVASLAIGIGANATVFSLVDRLVFSAPPHIALPDQLYSVNVRYNYHDGSNPGYTDAISYNEYLAIHAQSRLAQSVAAHREPYKKSIGKGPDAAGILESIVSTNFFDVLGTQPHRGRFFFADDDSAKFGTVAGVISYGFWQRHFGGADSAIGARLNVSSLNVTVVGVAPEGFTGVLLNAADLWVPIGATWPIRSSSDWKSASTNVVVRLKPGVAATSFNAEASVLLRRMPTVANEQNPDETVTLGSIIPARGPSAQTGEVRVAVRLMIASVIVLIAACANLANLLLVRALSRRREIALRLAVGISRGRLVSQMLVEALLISALGTAVALIFAQWSGAAMRSLVFPNMQWATGVVSVRLFAFASTIGAITAMLASLAPAIRMTRADVARALRSAAPQITASTGRLRQTLLAMQFAVSVVLVVGASAFGASLKRSQEFDLGFDAERLITARMWPESDSLAPPRRLETLQAAEQKIRLLDGVESTVIAATVPLGASTMTSIRIGDRELPKRTFTRVWSVVPEFQQTMGFRLVKGRWITREDIVSKMYATLVSETGAHNLWPNSDPIGKCIRIGDDTRPCQTVVGIVRDISAFSFRDERELAMITGVPYPTIFDASSGYIIIRARAGVKLTSIIASVRSIIRTLQPDLRSIEVVPITESLEGDFRPLKLGVVAFSAFSVLTIMLSAIGLYGILAFSVNQRRGEFGIRSALGAQARDLVALVLREGAVIAVAGVGAGLIVSWYASRAVSTFLFKTDVHSVVMYAFPMVLFGGVVVAAAAVPAWRASRVDPASALRAE